MLVWKASTSLKIHRVSWPIFAFSFDKNSNTINIFSIKYKATKNVIFTVKHSAPMLQQIAFIQWRKKKFYVGDDVSASLLFYKLNNYLRGLDCILYRLSGIVLRIDGKILKVALLKWWNWWNEFNFTSNSAWKRKYWKCLNQLKLIRDGLKKTFHDSVVMNR